MEIQKKSLRILLITPYYPPEMGAPQARISGLAVRLARSNHKVTVLTGFPSYPTGIIFPEYRGKWFMREEREGVNIVRTWIYPTSNTRLYWRLATYFSFVFSSIASSFRCGKADVIYVESPPLFDGMAGYVISKFKRAPFLFNVADLWPDFAVELGLLRKGFLLSAAYLMESFFYDKAAKLATVTNGLIERLKIDKNVPENKLVLLRNGVDVKMFHPEISGSEIRQKLNLQDKFTIGYTGNFGHWQGLDTVIDAARLLSDDPQYHFLLIGGGAKKEVIGKHIEDKKLRNVTMLPVQPRNTIPSYLAAMDCAVVPLRNVACAELALPVKMFEAMAMAKPLILGIGGEARDLVSEAEAGIIVKPENPESYAKAVIELAQNASKCEKFGKNGRKYVVEHLNRDILTEKVEETLLNMACNKNRNDHAR